MSPAVGDIGCWGLAALIPRSIRSNHNNDCHPERSRGTRSCFCAARRIKNEASLLFVDPSARTGQMLYFVLMISLEDARWSNLTGGYKMPFDPRPLLEKLATDCDATDVWSQLWDELHHQGDVGEASFAAVPFLVRSYRKRGDLDWNTYALVAIIELARAKGNNPDVPQWLKDDYFRAIRELAEIGATEVLQAEAEEDVRAILSVLAIAGGLRLYGELLMKYAEDELREIVSDRS